MNASSTILSINRSLIYLTISSRALGSDAVAFDQKQITQKEQQERLVTTLHDLGTRLANFANANADVFFQDLSQKIYQIESECREGLNHVKTIVDRISSVSSSLSKSEKVALARQQESQEIAQAEAKEQQELQQQQQQQAIEEDGEEENHFGDHDLQLVVEGRAIEGMAFDDSDDDSSGGEVPIAPEQQNIQIALANSQQEVNNLDAREMRCQREYRDTIILLRDAKRTLLESLDEHIIQLVESLSADHIIVCALLINLFSNGSSVLKSYLRHPEIFDNLPRKSHSSISLKVFSKPLFEVFPGKRKIYFKVLSEQNITPEEDSLLTPEDKKTLAEIRNLAYECLTNEASKADIPAIFKMVYCDIAGELALRERKYQLIKSFLKILYEEDDDDLAKFQQDETFLALEAENLVFLLTECLEFESKRGVDLVRGHPNYALMTPKALIKIGGAGLMDDEPEPLEHMVSHPNFSKIETISWNELFCGIAPDFLPQNAIETLLKGLSKNQTTHLILTLDSIRNKEIAQYVANRIPFSPRYQELTDEDLAKILKAYQCKKGRSISLLFNHPKCGPRCVDLFLVFVNLVIANLALVPFEGESERRIAVRRLFENWQIINKMIDCAMISKLNRDLLDRFLERIILATRLSNKAYAEGVVMKIILKFYQSKDGLMGLLNDATISHALFSTALHHNFKIPFEEALQGVTPRNFAQKTIEDISYDLLEETYVASNSRLFLYLLPTFKFSFFSPTSWWKGIRYLLFTAKIAYKIWRN